MTPKQDKEDRPSISMRIRKSPLQAMKEYVGEGQGGSAGGTSLFIRRLIHRELGEPVPEQWEKETSPALAVQNCYTAACADLDRWERDGPDSAAAESLFKAVKESAKSEVDPINRTLALQILGRLTLLLDK